MQVPILSSSLIEMIKCRWREFRREPSALFFVVLMPIVWLVILGQAFSGSSETHRTLGLLTNPESSSQIINSIRDIAKSDPSLTLLDGTKDELMTLIKRGRIDLIFQVDHEQINYLFDPSNKAAQAHMMAVDLQIQNHMGRKDVITTVVQPLDIPGGRYIDFLIPGLLAFSILTSSIYGTGMTLVSNRRENLLKRYKTTPMSSFEFIFSHIVGRGIVLAVEMASILVTGVLLFDFEIQGSYLDFVILAFLGAAAMTALSMLIGSRTRNTSAYNGIANLITLPMMILSGVWFSRSNFPDWMQGIIDVMPLTPLVDGLRKVALEGMSLSALPFELTLICVYTIMAVIGARLTFKWY